MKLCIADLFTAPGPRKINEGAYSAESFRDTVLVPLLCSPLTVILDGTAGYSAGYSAGFLEETFGGLIREHGFTLEQLDSILTIESSEEPELLDEIRGYMEDAEAARK